MRAKSAAVLALCAVSFGLAACDPQSTPATVTPTAPVTVTPTTTTTAAKGAGRFVIISQGELKGAKGTLSYDLTVPGLGVEGTGVNYEAARAFNSCMNSRANAFVTQYAQAKSITDPNKRSKVEHIGTHVLSGMLLVSVDGGGNHPEVLLSTCVIDADTSGELGFGDVFVDQAKGLQLLSEEAAKRLPGTRAGDGYNKEGIAATAENFKSWTATPAGMHVYFDQGIVATEAAGAIDITVPWSALRAQLKPGLFEVLSS
ncbi:RsiV family protein [Nocardia sp. NPDC004722]